MHLNEVMMWRSVGLDGGLPDAGRPAREAAPRLSTWRFSDEVRRRSGDEADPGRRQQPPSGTGRFPVWSAIVHALGRAAGQV
jgi:hypothetical protein